jgi:hypothetical protein
MSQQNQNAPQSRRPRADTTAPEPGRETTAGGSVDRISPPAAEPAPPPTQIAPVIRCPECRSQNVRHNGKQGGVCYYRCNFCVDPASGTWTTFKVLETDPLAPTTKVTPEEAERATARRSASRTSARSASSRRGAIPQGGTETGRAAFGVLGS